MKAEPWGASPRRPASQEFGAFDKRPFAELDMADPDVDGDTLLDGEDDQDNDDIINIREMYEAVVVGTGHGDGGFNCGGTTYPSLDMDPGAGVDPGGQRLQPLRPESGLAYLRCLEALRVDPFPVVPPPTWRPHPRL